VLTTTVIRGDGVVEHEGLVADDLADETCLIWVDSTGPDEGDIQQISGAFPLHQLAVEDVRRHGQRAKLEAYPDHAFLVAYARAADGDLSEVDFFIGPNWLVTVREANAHGEIFDVTEVRARYHRVRGVDRHVGFLLYVVLDALVDGYFDAIEQSEDGLEAVEEILFDLGPPPDGSLQKDLLELRKTLVMFRRRVVPLRDVVLSILRREVEWIEDESIIYFQDVLDHLLRVIDQIDTQRELMGNVVDASLAIGANRMNEVMKKMTSWGAILIVATLIAGIYGMNFKNMPELSWHYGYFVALSSMLVITGGLYLYFKRKSWL
jgi:magnesium transporter